MLSAFIIENQKLHPKFDKFDQNFQYFYSVNDDNII